MSDDLYEPADARELLGLVELTGITYYEVRGKRHEDRPATASTSTPSVMVRYEPMHIEVRMAMTVDTGEAAVLADIGATYTLTTACQWTKPLAAEFTEKVGIMAVYPFVRESVFATASRMNVRPPVMGLLHAGAFKVDLGDEGDTLTPKQAAEALGVSANTIRTWLREAGAGPDARGRFRVTPALRPMLTARALNAHGLSANGDPAAIEQ